MLGGVNVTSVLKPPKGGHCKEPLNFLYSIGKIPTYNQVLWDISANISNYFRLFPTHSFINSNPGGMLKRQLKENIGIYMTFKVTY